MGNMRLIGGSIILLLALISTSVGQDKPAAGGTLVFTHVTVIDVTGGPPKRDVTVVVKNDRISAIGRSENSAIPVGAKVIDGTGKYLIPGLWDMHVHVFNNVSKRPPNEYYFPLMIANGVTSVRDMWVKPASLLQIHRWRKQFIDQPGTVPRFARVGTLIDGNPPAWPNSDIVTTAEQARAMVIRIKNAGIDFVKVYEKLSREAYFAIADESKRQKIPFAGHVPYEVVISETVAAGQQSIEHLTGLSKDCTTFVPKMEKELAAATSANSPEQVLIQKALDTCDPAKAFKMYGDMAEAGVFHVPTFPILKRRTRTYSDLITDPRNKYMPADELKNWKIFADNRKERSADLNVKAARVLARDMVTVSEMHRAGVLFVAGTDVGNEFIYPGFSLHDDLEGFVESGFTPFEALQTATINAARSAGFLLVGTIQVGRQADMVLLNADPLVDIRNTRKIEAVIVNGSYLDRTQLDAMLAKAESAAKQK